MDLYLHQQRGLEWLVRRQGCGALLWEPGTGKTRVCLALFLALRETTPALKLFVVSPLSILEAVWKTEAALVTPCTFTTVRKLDPRADIWAGNFEAVIRPRMQQRLEQAGLWNTPVLFVVDESSRCKDYRSLTTKTMLLFAARSRFRVICSGTPTPGGLHEIHAQMRIVDPDIFPKSFHRWRREWFFLGRNGRTLTEIPPDRHAMQQLFQSGWKWNITTVKQDQLLARCAPICQWLRKSACLTLPERISVIRHVTLSDQEQRAYTQMKQQLVVEFAEETITAEIALTKLMRLRQLASGFLYGETIRHHTGTSRLCVLLEILEELGNQPVIIWCQFQEEIEQILNMLGERAVTLYAETKDREDSLHRFGQDAQYLIAHPRSAGHGLTLTQASTCVWYSLDWSLESYLQANDRIHRIGQHRNCLYVHLIAPGLIDEQIWEVLQRKRTLQAAIDAVLGVKCSRAESQPGGYDE